MKYIKQSFLFTVLSFLLVSGVSIASSWVGPTAEPPNNNVSAPINVSSVSQTKTGNLSVGGFSLVDGTQGSGKFLTSDAGGKASWVSAGGGGGVGGSGTANYVPKWTSTFSLSNSQIFDDGTYVGIGTNAPKNRLHIKGTNWPALFVDSSDAKGGFIGYGNNSKTGWATGMEEDGTWRLESYIGSGDWRNEWSNGWVDGVSGINVITAKKDGKVGLGTVAPEAVLHLKAGNKKNDPWAFRLEQGQIASGNVLTSDASGNAYWAPPAQVQVQVRAFGGMYNLSTGGGCYYGNVFTGGCSCPAGYTASLVSTVHMTGDNNNQQVFYCYR